MINRITKGIIILFIIPILYFIIICPISLFLRFINKEFISIKFDKNENSYWLIKHKIRHEEKKRREAEDFYKQL
jgi:uncharacterized protein (DUF2225 family)